MSTPNRTTIKSSFLFSDGKLQVYLVINYQKKTFTLKRSGYNSGNNETSFIFKDTKNDTRGLLQLMVQAQEFALVEIGAITPRQELKDYCEKALNGEASRMSKPKGVLVKGNMAEGELDIILTGTGYQAEKNNEVKTVVGDNTVSSNKITNKELENFRQSDF